jgi:predicted ATPase
MQRARAVQPAFTYSDDVLEICRRLDGLPLAIELCAPRVGLLSVKELLARVDQSLDIASTSSVTPERQRTLREAIAWSYELLSPEHRRTFRRLGVFSGGAGLPAIQKVATGINPLEILAELNDAKLITRSQTGRPEGTRSRCSRPSTSTPPANWRRPTKPRRSTATTPRTSQTWPSDSRS